MKPESGRMWSGRSWSASVVCLSRAMWNRGTLHGDRDRRGSPAVVVSNRRSACADAGRLRRYEVRRGLAEHCQQVRVVQPGVARPVARPPRTAKGASARRTTLLGVYAFRGYQRGVRAVCAPWRSSTGLLGECTGWLWRCERGQMACPGKLFARSKSCGSLRGAHETEAG